jgi:hypothetical protein
MLLDGDHVQMAVVKALLILVVGFAAFAVINWAWVVWLPVLAMVNEDYGGRWGLAALIALFALAGGIGLALWKLQDRLTTGASGRGRPAADVLYCQRCGAPARLSDQFCASCGGTHLAMRRPKLAQP